MHTSKVKVVDLYAQCRGLCGMKLLRATGGRLGHVSHNCVLTRCYSQARRNWRMLWRSHDRVLSLKARYEGIKVDFGKRTERSAKADAHYHYDAT